MRLCVYLPILVPCSLNFSFLCVWPAVDHPRYAKLIDEHTKSDGPKCLPKRHLNCSLFFQCMKYAFRLRNLLDAEAHGKAMRFLVVIGWNVRTHQVLTADREAGVHDLAAPFYWYMFRGGRALVREHGF